VSHTDSSTTMRWRSFVEALRTYRETSQEGAMKSLTADLQFSPQQAADVLGRIEAVLERLPKRGVTL
jgi:heme oxygenase